MGSVFLDASVLKDNRLEQVARLIVKRERIRFEFPDGFQKLSLIEECRALNATDVSKPENFDLMYDMTMQMLSEKPVRIHFIDDGGTSHMVSSFVVTNRYMNLRSVDFIDEYPVVVNWLVEWVAGMLAKKFPHSLEDIRGLMSARNEERTKNPMQKKEKVTVMQFQK